MTPFTTVRSSVIPILRDNIDTDAIIPSREIRSVSKTGLAGGLFARWRYLDENRTANPDFVLNQDEFAGASVLAGGRNFGCGSSREQAVWALREYGIRVIIAPTFNSIFQRNCIRNGLLPLSCDPHPIVAAGEAVTVDLEHRSIVSGSGAAWTFDIDESDATMLLLGLDEIELTLRSGKAIRRFRDADKGRRPWIYL